MKTAQIVLTVVLSAAVAFGVAHYAGPAGGPGVAAQKETRFERVKRTGVLRCGYFEWPPVVIKDPNTGKMQGMIPDVVEEMAKQLGLRVDWVAEVDMAHMFSGYDRYDMVCSPVSRTGGRARESDFTMPVGYAGLYVFVRADDHRFDDKLAALNAPGVKFSVIDGEYSRTIVGEDFPQATPVAVTQMASGTQMMMEVAAGKADAAIADAFSGQAFMDSNPGKIKLASATPVRVMSFSLPVPPNEYELKSAMDAALFNLFETGYVEKVYSRYDKGVAKILRPAAPYKN